LQINNRRLFSRARRQGGKRGEERVKGKMFNKGPGDPVVVAAARTPFGKFGGALKELKAVELGAIVLREVLKRAQLPAEDPDYVLMGMVLQAAAGQIPSRQASVLAGIPWEVPSETINKVCISSLRAVSAAAQMIRAGDARIILAGGMESMSNAPYALTGSRWGMRMGDGEVVDLMVYDGLTCAFHNVHMGAHGSTMARQYQISRREQDEWALRSHQLAVAAQDKGLLREEIVPVTVPQKKGTSLVVDRDEAPRQDTSLEKLSKLPGLFAENSTVTAGNAPGVNDGASALLIMTRAEAQKRALKPLATIIGQAMAAREAAEIAAVPGLAVEKLLNSTGVAREDVALFEINEAFAAVPLVSGKIVGWDPNRVNVNGGAVAFGHPIGASGGRIVTTLIYELNRRGGGIGVAAICGGGAQGDALMVMAD